MFPRYLSITHIGVLALVLCCGCGGIQTEPVSGVVTLDGDPLTGVQVIFYPVEGDRKNSVGTTDETGAYSLNYTRHDVGAIVGEYKVLISKRVSTDKGEIETLPKKFNRESNFKAKVTSTGDNKFDFALESD